ncbi:thiolase C-terminal domain-containing protein [Novosphingobium album (ex Liu et al. 2023)]|uniref:Thiolase n=1 Tax=Novosphingobium album (ex Liu et al. 2023) TaxID=3031130 RepID=A0ABT5WXA0_9SPHN|nr:thiolase [Novosphingobium album (ex Liu et al. 2023)]MDE8654521.1 thiolase [Novosphingobium album (ex Liu et al. 2023)]
MSGFHPLRDRTAIVGIGATPYYRRGQSAPRTMIELVGAAIIAAIDDAGLRIADIDGFAFYSGGFDTGLLMETLGIPEVTFTASITGAGGGSAGAVGLAASAIVSGAARTVICVGGLQQIGQRFGAITASYAATPETAFFASAGLIGPGHLFALLASRHMHLYGTTREHLAAVALNARANALATPHATMHRPLTREDYFAAPMIAEPHCLFDFCLENDGAIAAVVTSAERARDLRHRPIHVMAGTHGGAREWGRSLYWMNMPDETFASSGNAAIARRLYAMAGIGPEDIDIAQFYDHFTSQVIMQIEDYGFCAKGEGGPFAASGAIAVDGTLPINTDGGQLSGGYIWGMTHIREAVEQLRGTAANQVAGAEVALVTGGPSTLPVSGLILRR